MIQVFVLPKGRKINKSRRLVSIHLSGHEVSLIAQATAAFVVFALSVSQTVEAIFIGIVASLCCTAICQLRYMQVLHLPPEMVNEMPPEVWDDNGGRALMMTSIKVRSPSQNH